MMPDNGGTILLCVLCILGGKRKKHGGENRLSNLAWPLDHSDFNSEVSFIQLASLQQKAFLMSMDSITSQLPFSCDDTRKQL